MVINVFVSSRLPPVDVLWLHAIIFERSSAYFRADFKNENKRHSNEMHWRIRCFPADVNIIMFVSTVIFEHELLANIQHAMCCACTSTSNFVSVARAYVRLHIGRNTTIHFCLNINILIQFTIRNVPTDDAATPTSPPSLSRVRIVCNLLSTFPHTTPQQGAFYILPPLPVFTNCTDHTRRTYAAECFGRGQWRYCLPKMGTYRMLNVCACRASAFTQKMWPCYIQYPLGRYRWHYVKRCQGIST